MVRPKFDMPSCTIAEFHKVSLGGPTPCPCGYPHRDGELIDAASARLGLPVDSPEYHTELLNTIKDHVMAAMVMAAYAAADKTLTVDLETYTYICTEVFRTAQRAMQFGDIPKGKPF